MPRVLRHLLWAFGWVVGLGWSSAQEPERIELRTDHVDLRIVYAAEEPDPLQLRVRNEDQAVNHATTNAVLVVAESARVTLPADFPPLGSAGDDLWILPQSQDPNLLYLGLSAEGLPEILGATVSLGLVRVEGPGHVLIWQSDAFGGLDVRVNTRDGIGEGDRVDLVVGSHAHYNFGFASNGVYRVWVQVVGRRTGETTNLVSAPTPIEFQVEPVPLAPKGAFARWQEAHWPGILDPGVIGAASDPDRDGRANLEEYATGTDPKVADSAPAVAPSIAIAQGGAADARALRIASLVVATADEVTPVLATAQVASGPWRRLEPIPAVVEESLESVPVRRRWTWTLARPENAGAAFYRVEYVLGTEP